MPTGKINEDPSPNIADKPKVLVDAITSDAEKTARLAFPIPPLFLF